MQRVLLCLSLTLPISVPATFAQDGIHAEDQLGEAIAEIAKTAIQQKGLGNQPYRIAVFGFSNDAGTVPSGIGERIKILMGEVRSSLKGAGLTNSIVATTRGIARDFVDAQLDPRDIDVTDPVVTAQQMQQLGWNVLVTAELQVTGAQDLKELQEDAETFKVATTVVFQDGSVDQGGGDMPVPGDSIETPDCPPSPITGKKFALEMIVDGAPVEMKVCNDSDSIYYGVYFVEIPTDWVTGSKEYSLRLRVLKKESESGGLTYRPVNDKRAYVAALLVDGVNTLAESTGPGTYDLVVRHPRRCSKWVLTNPDHAVFFPSGQRADSSEFPDREGFAVRQESNAPSNHSQAARTDDVGVKGFVIKPTDSGVVANFTIAATGAGQTAAELLGITEDIGMISAYFYAEKISDSDQRALPIAGVGTAPGRTEPIRVIPVKLPYHKDPVQVIRIFYRSAGQTPPEATDLQPITVPQ